MLLSRHPYSNKHKALERGRSLPAAAYIQLFSHVDVCHSAEQYVTLAVQIMSVTALLQGDHADIVAGIGEGVEKVFRKFRRTKAVISFETRTKVTIRNEDQ